MNGLLVLSKILFFLLERLRCAILQVEVKKCSLLRLTNVLHLCQGVGEGESYANLFTLSSNTLYVKHLYELFSKCEMRLSNS
jgi:hypothetical protein